MAKLLRGHRKSPDAEQLLTPRKNGFFGKRNNGVRSEDPEKPKTLSARRLVTSVFKRNYNDDDDEDDDDDKSPVDGSPPIRLDLLGAGGKHGQKNGMVANNNGNSNSNNKNLVVMTTNSSGRPTRDEETVMSDLTGTVSPPSRAKALANRSAANSNGNSHKNGVTFAATPTRQDSFHSAYSPPVGPFQQTTATSNDNSINGDTQDGETLRTTGESTAATRDFCKPTVLEQVLGVVDGACNRTMDMSLLSSGWTRSSSHANNGSRRFQQQHQWGTAPSEDDDSTNFLDSSTALVTTAGDTTTCFTRETMNYYPRDNNNNKKNDRRTVVPAPAPQPESLESKSKTTFPHSSSKSTEVSPNKTSPSRFQNNESIDSTTMNETELHENFELVLGQIELPGYHNESDDFNLKEEEPKKRGWGARILQRPDIILRKAMGADKEEEKKEDHYTLTEAVITTIPTKPVLSSSWSPSPPSPAAAATKPITTAPVASTPFSTPVKVAPKEATPSTDPVTPSPTSPSIPSAVSKQEKREALFRSVLENELKNRDAKESPSRDVGVEIQSSRVLLQQDLERKQLEQIAAAKNSKFPMSPPKGLTSLVKRLRFGKIRRTKSTSSVPPPKRANTGTLNNINNNNNKTNNKTFQPSETMAQARGQSVPPSATGRASAIVPTPAKAHPDPPAFSPRPPLMPSPKALEEEKKEIEPHDMSPNPPYMVEEETNRPVTNLDVPQINDTSMIKSMSNALPSVTIARRPSRPEMKGLSSDPVLPIKASNSFVLGDDPSRRPATDVMKTLGVALASTPKPLEESISINRLRSAPYRLSSAEALERREMELKKERASLEQQLRGSFAGAQNPTEIGKAVLDEDDGLTALESLRKKAPKLTWKTATDAQGRTYYYHRETRQTTWVKPKEFDAEVAAVKKFKEEMELAKKEASETQQIVEGYKSVEAIQKELRKKTQRDFDPEVWKTKQEILDIVKEMPLPQGTNIEKLLVQYDGKEEQLLANLRDLVESKPFDEPFQPTRSPSRKEEESSNELSSPADQSLDHPAMIDSSPLNISHASSISVNSSAIMNTVDVQHRVRTAVSASTRISEKTYLTEKTEKVRNTSQNPAQQGIEPISEGATGGISTGSISSASATMPPRSESIGFPPSGRVPSKIPAVPRSRELKVEEFSSNRIAKETYNGEGVVPHNASRTIARTESPVVKRGPPSLEARQGSPKDVAKQIVAMSSLDDDDDDSYNGDYEETVDDRGNDTASEKIADSISALSEADVDYQAQKENFERARRRALDMAVEREDWDLAAALSEGMKQVKEPVYGNPQQREWTQTELDRFISENDWDAVSKYIAHMRDRGDHPRSPGASNTGSHISIPRGRDPGTGRDPDGLTQLSSSRMPGPGPVMGSGPPAYVSEATKRASTHTQKGRRQQQERMNHTVAATSEASSEGSNKRAQTRFGARSQLQHSDLNSISSWTNSSRSTSSCDSEYTDNSYESEDEHGYISLRVRRNEFEC